MEENVALDSKKQKKFVKSIKGIKKLIKKNKNEEPQEDKVEAPPKPFSMRLNVKKNNKRKQRNPKGLVYLGHIPHGFYEHQMTQYFKQFGVVTNARVIRSKRTGNSKGYAFVEFKDPSVAEIVAETMNNYLMGKRLIKAALIPPEKQRRAFRMKWSTKHNPASEKRLNMRKAYNENKDDAGELVRARKLLSNLNKTKKRLREMGINYDFFAPVDIPEPLLDSFIKKEDDSTDVKDTKTEKKDNKKEKKAPKLVDKNVKNKDTKTEPSKKVTNVKENKDKDAVKSKKKGKTPVTVNKQEQKDKKQKMKDAGMKPPEEFIKVEEDDSNDSDSSYEFDSDEYEKVLELEDNDLPSGESEGSDDEEDDDDDEGSDDEEDDDSDEEVPPKQVKGKPAVVPKVAQPQKTKGQAKQNINKKPPQEIKRKAPQNYQGSTKKPKFEKQNQKPMKKHFKKK